jgi:hypothetical protein
MYNAQSACSPVPCITHGDLLMPSHFKNLNSEIKYKFCFFVEGHNLKTTSADFMR